MLHMGQSGGLWGVVEIRPITCIYSIYLNSSIYYLISSICIDRYTPDIALNGLIWLLETRIWEGGIWGMDQN